VKLYYSPFACSLSPHIALREAGVPFELMRVDLRTKRAADGEDYNAVNPKGYVPALRLDDGEVLSEGPAIVQYVADLKPDSTLAPSPGSFARYRLQEWLNFISTELHKQFSPLFAPTLPEGQRAQALKKIRRRVAHVEQTLAERPFLLGEDFTVADIYLFVVLRWRRRARVDISSYSRVDAYLARIAERPHVAAAVAFESQIKGTPD
jgi:glutathione S-transferase